jgi:hypothetical protein
MGQKENARLSEATGGQLKYLQSPVILVGDLGHDLDFTNTEDFTFEAGRLKCNHLEIFNNGPGKCMIGFDTQANLVDCLDRSTFSFTIYPGKPFNYISLDGEADSMSLRTLAGTTAELEIIVW